MKLAKVGVHHKRPIFSFCLEPGKFCLGKLMIHERLALTVMIRSGTVTYPSIRK